MRRRAGRARRQVKDLDLGLLDFPALRDGEDGPALLAGRRGRGRVLAPGRRGLRRPETDRLGRIERSMPSSGSGSLIALGVIVVAVVVAKLVDWRISRHAARAGGRDALPRAAPRDRRDDRLRRRPLGAARDPAGARGRGRDPRLVGRARARDRLRRPAHARQRDRRDPDRRRPSRSGSATRSRSRGRRASSRRSGSRTRGSARATTTASSSRTRSSRRRRSATRRSASSRTVAEVIRSGPARKPRADGRVAREVTATRCT